MKRLRVRLTMHPSPPCRPPVRLFQRQVLQYRKARRKCSKRCHLLAGMIRRFRLLLAGHRLADRHHKCSRVAPPMAVFQ